MGYFFEARAGSIWQPASHGSLRLRSAFDLVGRLVWWREEGDMTLYDLKVKGQKQHQVHFDVAETTGIEVDCK